MSMSPWGDADRTPLRLALAAVAAYDLVFLLTLATRPAGQLDVVGAASIYDALLLAPAVLAMITGVGIAAAVLFARGSHTIMTGAVVLVALHFGEECGARAFRTLPPEPFVPGLMLFGWLVGAAWTRATGGAARDERLADLGAVAACAASYGLAGFAKLARSGLEWDHRLIWHVALSGLPVDGDGWQTDLTQWLLGAPQGVDLLARGAIAIQLFALVMPFGPRLRQLAAALLLAMHTSMFVIGRLVDIELIVVLLVFARLWAPQWRRQHTLSPAPDSPAPDSAMSGTSAAAMTPPWPVVVLLLALVAVAWLSPLRSWMAYEPILPRLPWSP